MLMFKKCVEMYEFFLKVGIIVLKSVEKCTEIRVYFFYFFKCAYCDPSELTLARSKKHYFGILVNCLSLK